MNVDNAFTEVRINSADNQTAYSPTGSEAIRLCDQAVSELLTTRGQLQMVQGNLQLAIADFTQAASLDPNNALALYCRGLAHDAVGDSTAANADHTSALHLDSDAKMRTGAYARLESGYRVIAMYNSGREDHRPIEFFPDSPEGFRQAIRCAKNLGRFRDKRSALDNRYQVDDFDFLVVVQKYQLAVRDIYAVLPQDDPNDDPPDLSAISAHDRIQRVMPIPSRGHWLFWDRLFDQPATAEHPMTESQAAVHCRTIEATLPQLLVGEPLHLLKQLFRISLIPNPSPMPFAIFAGPGGLNLPRRSCWARWISTPTSTLIA